jgi:hypothetical protein
VKPVSRGLDRIEVAFDEPSLVADAGLIVPASLMARLGLEQLVNDLVRLAGHVGGARPGRKVLTLVTSFLAGGTHIDHADRLRAGATGRVLPFEVMAPSTLRTFLRSLEPSPKGRRAFSPPPTARDARSHRLGLPGRRRGTCRAAGACRPCRCPGGAANRRSRRFSGT